jgi:hypothetical protein
VWNNRRPIDPRSAKVPQSKILIGQDLVAFRARKREIDGMIAAADVERDDQPSISHAVAMKASTYHYEGENATSRPEVQKASLIAQTEPSRMRKNDLMPLKPALSSTRGMR